MDFGVRKLVAFGCVAVLLILCGGEDCKEKWNYAENGPSEWPSLCANCSGRSQSPIAIWPVHIQLQPELPPLQLFNYQHVISGLAITDNGHTAFVQIPVDNTAYIVVPTKPGKRYRLQQLHFHWGFRSTEGSEHTVGNQKFPIEIHIVHKADDGSLAVVAVFGQVSCDAESPVLLAITNTLSNARESAGETATVSGNFTISEFLPANRQSFFVYSGSLTTPPCSEIVEWLIFTSPVNIKTDTLEDLRGLRDPNNQFIENNYRPTQGLYGRTIKLRGTRMPQYNFTVPVGTC